MLDLLIVGGGPAGLSAALYGARSGLEVLLVEKTFVGGQASTANIIENYPGFPDGVAGPELAMDMEKQARKAGASVLFSEVQEIHLGGETKTVKLAHETLEARAIILTMGATRRPLGVPGEAEFAGRGVSFCGTCDGNFFRGRTVAVVGGGNTAAEDALYLSNIASRVLLIHRRDRLRAGELLEKRMREHPNIEMLWETTVTRIMGGETMEAIETMSTFDGSKKIVPLDGLFIAVGNEPQTALVQDQLRLDGGYIPADETTLTEIPGVFAAGDIRKKLLRQVVTAAADGAQAATAAWAYLNQVDDIVRTG